MAILASIDTSVVTKNHRLTDAPVLIGRHPECTVQIDDGSVSRHHAKIVLDQGAYFVEDLNSRNGTYLNDQPVHQPTKLYDGSLIRICDVTFTFFLTDQFSEIPRATIEGPGTGTRERSNQIIMDDVDSQSQLLSKLEIPSHYSQNHHKVSAEEKLKTLINITHVLADHVDRDEILEKILDFLFELFVESDRGFIILQDETGNLRPLGFKTRRQNDDEEIRISRTICKQVMESQHPILSSDAGADDRFDMSQSVFDFRIRSIMCAPLINSKNESIGVIQLDTLRRSVVFKEEDLEMLVTIALQASLAIQQSDLFAEAKKTNELKADLALAHELQQRFLPQHSPELESYEFFSYYRPMQQVGGDYFDYLPLDENRLGVIVADVVGHGIAAAMLMAKVSAEAKFALATSKSAVEAMNKINQSLSGMNIDRFVTMSLCLIDRRSHTLNIVNAGHMPPIIRRADGSIETIASTESGLPLGIFEDFEYAACTAELRPGDVAIMYTDGMNEAMNEKDELLSTDAIIDELKVSQAKTAQTIGEQICQQVQRHMGFREPIDDMCLVCIGNVTQA
jgi:serine phosphatase RsbU (regulator of sigma subunit)